MICTRKAHLCVTNLPPSPARIRSLEHSVCCLLQYRAAVFNIVGRMAEMCGTCKDGAKVDYWHKLPVTKHKFFKIMLGNFKHQLRIPRKFVANFKGQLSSRCTLRGPNGSEWKVLVTRDDEDTMFSRGWKSFVRDHGIEEYDFLVLSYVDCSTFEVFVFDGSGCEREGSHSTQVNLSGSCCGSTFHLEDNKNAMKREGLSSFSAEETEMNDDDDTDDCEDYKEDREEKGEEEFFSCDPPMFKSVKKTQKCLISGRREVSDQERLETRTRAEEYLKKTNSCGVPMVGIVMLPTHVYKGLYLTIPKEWAMKYILRRDHEVELQVSGKNNYWVVGCRWSRVGQCQLRPKGAEFVLENNLEEGDVCVFELVRKGSNTGKHRPVFKVRIIRVVREVVPLKHTRMAV